MQEAFTSPLTPVRSSEPLISLISSSRAVRGTVSVYSTLAGLLCEPQFQVLSWSGYLVRIERELPCASISIFASSSRSLVSADLIASTFTSFRSQLEMCTDAVDVVEFNPAIGGEGISLMELLGQRAAVVGGMRSQGERSRARSDRRRRFPGSSQPGGRLAMAVHESLRFQWL